MQPTCIHCLTTHASVCLQALEPNLWATRLTASVQLQLLVVRGASHQSVVIIIIFNLGRSSRGGRQKLILEIIALMVSHPSGSHYYYYYLAHQHKAAGRKTRPDIQNYGLQRQFTLLLWCCGKKPHFLFAEPWKGIGKLLLLLLYVLNADSAGRPMN